MEQQNACYAARICVSSDEICFNAIEYCVCVCVRALDRMVLPNLEFSG